MAGGLASAAARRHRLGLLAVVLAVVVVHACVTNELADRLVASATLPAMPPRIEVAYVRDMVLATAPVAAPAAAVVPTKPAARTRPIVPKPAASAPVAAVPPEPEAAPLIAEVLASTPIVVPEPAPPIEPAASALAVEPVVAAALPASAVASGAAPFDWPASTRLTYKLTGYYRGDVEGDAQVEWVRAGARYQVHLDFTIGAPFAPLITRRMSSDGELTPEGLAPRRYDQDTKFLFRDAQRLSVLLEPDAVVLANGERRERLAGVQDTASQFVQMSYLFATRPELLRSGASVEIPLAFPRKVERWTYDVLEQETIHTSFGALPAVHLKPRRELRAGGDLVAEIWFAPQLRYLPVRIRIQQDTQTFIDLLIARRPELAAP